MKCYGWVSDWEVITSQGYVFVVGTLGLLVSSSPSFRPPLCMCPFVCVCGGVVVVEEGSLYRCTTNKTC